MSEPADRELLRELYERYAAQVYGRCRYLLGDDEEARDAMHDVFVKVIENLHTYRGQSSRLTWIVRIATNHCLNLLRARRAKWRSEIERIARFVEQMRDDDHAAIERLDLVRALVARCDRRVQEVAIYYFVDEMTQEEIARTVGISVPTVRKRLRTFLRIARREMRRLAPGLVLEEMAL